MNDIQDPIDEDGTPDGADEARPDCFMFGVDDDPTFDAMTSLQVAGRFASRRQASDHSLQVQAHFLAAPESVACGGVPSTWIADLIDFAHEDFGVAVAHLTPAQVDELVFVIAPRHMALGPAAAPTLLGEARALFDFLGRAYRAPNAAGWRQVLRSERGDELVRRFADSSGFSADKAAYMRGFLEAGGRRPKPASVSGRRKRPGGGGTRPARAGGRSGR